MNETIISSKSTALFSHMQLFLIFVVSMIVSSVSDISILQKASFAVWAAVFIKKEVKLDVTNKKIKDGPLKSWKELPENGYISIVRKVNKNSKKLDAEGMKLLYVVEGESTYIYGPKDMEDANSTAVYLDEFWDCGVYQVHSKTWLRPKKEIKT